MSHEEKMIEAAERYLSRQPVHGHGEAGRPNWSRDQVLRAFCAGHVAVIESDSPTDDERVNGCPGHNEASRLERHFASSTESPPTQQNVVGTSGLIQALSRLTENRHSDGVSSVVSQEDRKAIIDGCHELMLAARQAPADHVVGVEPDFCYDPNEWEFTCNWDERDQVHGYGEGLTRGEPMEVATLIRGPRKWVADVPVTWDEHGDPDETDIRWFDSEEEALAALAATATEGSTDA